MSMEAPEYFIGGKSRAGNSQITPEKQGKDQFIVEELLDFSNEEEDENGVGAGDEGGSDAAAGGNLTDSSTVTAVDSCNSSFSGGDHLSLADAGDLCEPDLCEPYDELAELEWLSNFVEESFSSEDLRKLQLISGVQSSTSSSKATRDPIQTPLPAEAATFFLPEPAAVPGKARSKRSRAATCNWSSRLLVLSPNNTPATSSSSDSSGVPVLLKPNTLIKKSHKTAKKKESGGGMVGAALVPTEGRRCLHCATDKTPQWRTGPMGPKTLCNACGVRYKSGRLVPEYRPASSPTFILSKHSNSHRKVLELRRQKEVEQPQQPFGHVGSGALYDGGSAVAGEEFLIHHHIGPEFRQLI